MRAFSRYTERARPPPTHPRLSLVAASLLPGPLWESSQTKSQALSTQVGCRAQTVPAAGPDIKVRDHRRHYSAVILADQPAQPGGTQTRHLRISA